MHHTISRRRKFANSLYQISSWFQIIYKFPSSSWSLLLSFVAIPGQHDNRIVTVSLRSEQWQDRDCKSRSKIVKYSFLMKGDFFNCIANTWNVSARSLSAPCLKQPSKAPSLDSHSNAETMCMRSCPAKSSLLLWPRGRILAWVFEEQSPWSNDRKIMIRRCNF